ncbi:unnamed protein product, partial [Mycena citricolor]
KARVAKVTEPQSAVGAAQQVVGLDVPVHETPRVEPSGQVAQFVDKRHTFRAGLDGRGNDRRLEGHDESSDLLLPLMVVAAQVRYAAVPRLLHDLDFARHGRGIGRVWLFAHQTFHIPTARATECLLAMH